MQVKVSTPNGVITAKRGNGCDSVTEQSPVTLTGVVEGEYACIYEQKLSHKLIIQCNGTRYRVSGYDQVMEGDTISVIKKQAELGESTNKKVVYWYTMDNVVQPEPQQPDTITVSVGA
jgi:hypothetical protein